MFSAAALATLGFLAGPDACPAADLLARVEIAKPLESIPLPVHALLRDGKGVDYALVIAPESELAKSGWPYRILAPAGNPEQIVVATPMRPGAGEAASGRFDVIEDDGEQWLVRLEGESQTAELGNAGFALARLSLEALAWTRPLRASPAAMAAMTFTPDSMVSTMISRVSSGDLVWLVSQLSGEEPAPAAGELRTLTSRHTNSGETLTKASAFSFEYLNALGLDPAWHAWSRSGYSGSNIAGTQPGTTAADEIVLLVAHLDSMPSTGLAPGADDNASGSAGVLMAASVLSQYRFERTIRYLLVTGEEQGLLGSAVYAAAAKSAGDNIVAVVNLDMIAWDSNGDAAMRLYTRASSHPGYASDLAIASIFTSVISGYGLALSPLVTSNGMGASDHASFWNQGYPAVCGIEHYQGDFNAYYHTADDRLAHFNLPYFTSFAKAAVGTVAHLAAPVEETAFDVVRVVSGDWSAPGTEFGATVFHARHRTGAQETGDGLDLLCSNPKASWLKLATRPGAEDLATDSRPPGSETLFRAALSVVSAGEPVTCANRLRFRFLTPPDPKRIYSVRVQADGFSLVTDLRALVAAGGFVELPELTAVPNGTIYGGCEIASRFLDQDSPSMAARISQVDETQVLLSVSVQAGAEVEDAVELSTNLADPDAWSAAGTHTNAVPVRADNFDAGRETVTLPVNLPPGPPERGLFFRIRRTWLQPR